MGAHQVVAQLDGPDARHDLVDEKRVAQGLAHLLPGRGHPRVVQPVAGEGITGRAGLRYLVLMVREDEVQSAAVDIELRSQILLRHRRAFDVPSGSTIPPRGGPGGLTRLRALPHREVARIALRTGLRVVRGQHVVELLPAQRAVVRESADVEVDIPIGRIAVAAIDEALHQLHHLGDVPRGARLVRGWEAPEGVVGPGEGALIAHGHHPIGNILVAGVVQDLVVDVGDVAHEGDVVAACREPASDYIEGDSAADVSDMRGCLHGGAAEIDADLPRLPGHEVPDRSGGGVVEAHP